MQIKNTLLAIFSQLQLHKRVKSSSALSAINEKPSSLPPVWVIPIIYFRYIFPIFFFAGFYPNKSLLLLLSSWLLLNNISVFLYCYCYYYEFYAHTLHTIIFCIEFLRGMQGETIFPNWIILEFFHYFLLLSVTF